MRQVVKGPVTKHLPVGAERVGFTRTADGAAKLPGFVDDLRWQAGSPVLVLGAMAHGQLDITYVDRSALRLQGEFCLQACNQRVHAEGGYLHGVIMKA